MGQAMATMYQRFLGREAGNDHDGDEESLGFFDRFWRMVQRIISFLNRLPRGVADTPPSNHQIPIHPNPDDSHFIDIGIDDLAFHSRIPEIPVTLVENNVADDKLPLVEQRPLVYDVAVTKAETVEGGISHDTGRISPVPENTTLGSLGHYSWDQSILLVGEGDFSFSTSLAVAFGDASNMIATSLNHIDFLQKNYKKAEKNILELKGRGCKVMHGVDATKMANSHRLQSIKFDCIVYNFPHAGFSKRQANRDAEISKLHEHHSKHQELVRGFMANAKTMIKPEGQIHIAHKCIGFFRQWNLRDLGTTEGLRLVEESPFKLKDYPGYSTKYGYGGDGDFNCNPSKTYKFQLATSSKNKRGKKQKK